MACKIRGGCKWVGAYELGSPPLSTEVLVLDLASSSALLLPGEEVGGRGQTGEDGFLS